jgi:hypothetical protein
MATEDFALADPANPRSVGRAKARTIRAITNIRSNSSNNSFIFSQRILLRCICSRNFSDENSIVFMRRFERKWMMSGIETAERRKRKAEFRNVMIKKTFTY